MGSTIQSEVEAVGQKPSSKEKSILAARKRVLAKYLGEDPDKSKNQAFADPAAFFG